MQVIAFDIDGALDSPHGIELYRNMEALPDTVVGIVTARSRVSLLEFVQQKDLNPQFKISTGFKGRALKRLKADYPDATSYIYYGSWLRDRFHAMIARWEYRQI